MEYSEYTIDCETVIAYAFAPYTLKRGQKELGEKWYTAVTGELYQLHVRDAFCTKSAKHLTKEQNRDALESLIFLMLRGIGE